MDSGPVLIGSLDLQQNAYKSSIAQTDGVIVRKELTWVRLTAGQGKSVVESTLNDHWREDHIRVVAPFLTSVSATST